jgi:predicted DsbA family dithiol-disulfide isomerase
LQKELDIALDWRGFELHPETPPGGIPLAELFGASRAQAMRRHMRAFAAQFGLSDIGDPPKLPNTRRALAIAELARERGVLEAFRRSAMNAHWREGRDLEKDDDLRLLSQRAGLDPDEALRAAADPIYQDRIDAVREEASDLGVTGIPTFFFDDVPIVGCQPYEVLARVARMVQAR